MTTIILGIFEEGLVYAIMALGVYITYRILDFRICRWTEPSLWELLLPLPALPEVSSIRLRPFPSPFSWEPWQAASPDLSMSS